MTAAIHQFQPHLTAGRIAAAYRVLESDDATMLQRLGACEVLERFGSANDSWTAGQVRIAMAPQLLREANREMADDILAERRHWRKMIALAALAGLCLGVAMQIWPGVF